VASMRQPLRPTGNARDVIEYLELPLWRTWWVVVPFLTCLAIAVVALFVVSPKYRSTTLILVESQKVPDSFVKQMATEKAGQQLQTLKQEVLSRTRLEKVAEELDPYGSWGKQPPGEIVAGMRAATDIKVRGDDAFTIEYVHSNPQMAQKVTARLAQLFIQETAKARERQVTEAYDFIDSQLLDARKQLERREGALRQYKETHMGTLPEQTNANLATLQRLQVEQQGLTEQLRASTEHLTLLQSGAAKTGPEDSAATELDQLRVQLEALRARYTEQHPDVIALRARIASLEASLKGRTEPPPLSLEGQVLEAQAEIARLRQRRDDVSRNIATMQARVEQAPRTEQELAELTRDYEKLNENYLSLLNKRMEAQMAARLEERWKGQQFRVLDPADLPDRPFYPNPFVFLAGGALIGLCLGLGLALAVDYLDHSIRSEKELEELLPFPLLASVPHVDPEREDRVMARWAYGARRPDDSQRRRRNGNGSGNGARHYPREGVR
jgi:polysaccharide chain length determinant protein (PEP-CTERM system associated)